MRTLGIGMRDERGFTLIEILIVLVILAITASVTVIAFGDFGASRKIVVAGEQFSAYIKLLQQKAILETTTLGITIGKDGYETYQFKNGISWQPMPKTSLFRWQSFPKNAVVKLQKSSKKSKVPDILIYASGDITPFKLEFGTTTQMPIFTLVGLYNGELHLNHDNK